MTPRPAKVVPATARLKAKASAERWARRRRVLRRAGIGAAAFAPLALLAWLLLMSPLLAVRHVAVTGTSRLSADQVRAAADVVRGMPLARVDASSVVRRVEALRAVADVRVTRAWPSTLKLQVVERTPVAGVVTRSGVVLVDPTGVLFADAPALPPGVVRLQVVRPGPKDPTTRAALGVLAVLPEPMRGRVRIIRAASPSSVTLVLRDGRRVLWGGVDDTALKVAAAEALLKMPGSVYDVSRPGVVTRR
ncbi:MAG: cell division protein FtsQ [Actinomycetota bacterium]|jgi:cell division protein FtsQ|nr:cell division protein FtsQ [Actinomycetota bacterium]